MLDETRLLVDAVVLPEAAGWDRGVESTGREIGEGAHDALLFALSAGSVRAFRPR